MKKIKIPQTQILSPTQMKCIVGGEKKLISQTLKTDELGTYYELRYDDGSIEFLDVDWLA